MQVIAGLRKSVRSASYSDGHVNGTVTRRPARARYRPAARRPLARGLGDQRMVAGRRRRIHARLVVALAVAAVLAVFLLYTAVAGNSTPTLTPNQIANHTNKLTIVDI